MSRLRYFLAAALVAGSMAVCAGAADTADRDALLETAVTHLQQQWQTGDTYAYDKTDDYYASIYSLMPEKNLYELYFSVDVSRHNHGIINMQTGKVIVPPEYDTVERLENDTFLLTKSGQEPNTLDCWFSDTEGNLTVAASGLPCSMICSAGEGMYILASYEKKPVRDVIFYEEPTVTQYDVLQYRLLDSDMNVVRGDLDGGIMVTPPTFHDGLMAIQTGSTLWDGSIKYGAYGNGKYGLIDTTGKFVSANDFDGIQWNYTRIIGKRGDRFYLIAPDGGETALPKNLDQYSAWTTAEVDSAGKHGLSLVNYAYCIVFTEPTNYKPVVQRFIDFNIHGDPVDVARQQPFCNPVNCLGDIIGQATEGQAQGGNNEQQRNDFLRHSGFFLSFSFVMLNTAAVVAATLPSWRIL